MKKNQDIKNFLSMKPICTGHMLVVYSMRDLSIILFFFYTSYIYIPYIPIYMGDFRLFGLVAYKPGMGGKKTMSHEKFIFIFILFYVLCTVI